MEFTQQVTAVLFVLAVLAATVWVLRARGLAGFSFPNRRRSVRRMQSLERLVLTPHHSLHLIRVDGQVVIVGVSPSGCQLIQSPAPGDRCSLESR